MRGRGWRCAMCNCRVKHRLRSLARQPAEAVCGHISLSMNALDTTSDRPLSWPEPPCAPERQDGPPEGTYISGRLRLACMVAAAGGVLLAALAGCSFQPSKQSVQAFHEAAHYNHVALQMDYPNER